MLIILLFYFKKRRFNGEITALYFLLYALGRSWIESLRTDQLMIGDTDLPISIVVSVVMIIVSIIFIIVKRIQANMNNIPNPNDLLKNKQ